MIDLHIHMGGAVPAAVLWELLSDSGLQTDFKTFDELEEYLTVRPEAIHNLDDFLNRYFHGTELIQSSPRTASESAYQLVAKAYRRSGRAGRMHAVEIRYNPLKRVREGLHTLDAIILATIHGLERASMHYRVQTGILFSMGKEFSHERNAIIVNAAMDFGGRGALKGAHGVVGIDMAGPESLLNDSNVEWLKVVGKMIEPARERGLGITWHVGETAHSGPDGMEAVLEWIRPQRIGHGIELRKAEGKQKERLCKTLRERQVCLEICPSVNLITGSILNLREIADLIRLLTSEGIPFCINTDNPYIIQTNLRQEYDLVAKALGEDAQLINQSHHHASMHSFLAGVRNRH